MRQRSRRAWGLDQSHEASAFLAPSRIKFIRPAYWNVKHLELKKSRNSLWCVWTNLWGRADATRADNSINLSRQCCEEKQSTRNSSETVHDLKSFRLKSTWLLSSGLLKTLESIELLLMDCWLNTNCEMSELSPCRFEKNSCKVL